MRTSSKRVAPESAKPKGSLTFKAIRVTDAGRVSYVGTMPVYDLLEKRFIAPVVSSGLSPEILRHVATKEPVQRKTSASHVQGILDYIVARAEQGEPWAFNSVVLYSTAPLEFAGVSIGLGSAGEARASEAFSVGEGLHRALAWAVALGLAKVAGVKRPPLSEQALRRIELASIPVLVIEEYDLRRQQTDFHTLNQQKPLTSTVLALTDASELSRLTRLLIQDVPLFRDRIDVNNASVSAASPYLLSFAQLRFVVASYLLGRRTRQPKAVERMIDQLAENRGQEEIRTDLRTTFSEVAANLGGLERLHRGKLSPSAASEFVRTLRSETLLASAPAWRALFVALHEAREAGLDPVDAVARVKRDGRIGWTRDAEFFHGSLLEVDPTTGRPTGKVLAGRESVDMAAGALLEAMLRP